MPKAMRSIYKRKLEKPQRKVNTDKEIFHATKVFGLKYNNDVTAVEKEIKREWNALSCIEIKIEHMTGKEAIELTRKRG